MPLPGLVLAAILISQAPGGPFISDAGGFRVLIPTKPTEGGQELATPFGPVEGHFFSASRGKVKFYASFADYPAQILEETPDRVLEGVMNGAVGGVPGAALRAKRDIKLGVSPGKEFEFAFMGPGGAGAVCRGRFYLVRTRLYSVMLQGPEPDVARAGDVFLASFALTGTYPPKPGDAPAKATASPTRPESPFTNSTGRPRPTAPGAAKKGVPPRPFTSAAGGFRVSIPGKPQERTISMRGPEGQVEAHLFVAVQDDLRYLVSYIDKPTPVASSATDDALEELVKGSILSGKGTLVSKQSVALGDSPGREFDFDTAGTGGRPRFVRARVYLVGSRIYQVLIGGPKEKVSGPVGDAYLGSFALTAASPR